MADFEALIKEHVGEDGGIPADAIGSVISAIKKAVGNEFVDKERYKTKLNEIDTLKSKLETAEDTATTSEKWKQKYEESVKALDDYKKERDAESLATAKKTAYEKLLKEAGVSEKRIPSVMKVTDLKTVELEEDGTVKGHDDLMKSITSEWSDFIVTKETRGANTTKPITNNGGKGMTKEEILAIKDTSERQKAMAENHELFGIE